jgi:penicillin-binding protein 1A
MVKKKTKTTAKQQNASFKKFTKWLWILVGSGIGFITLLFLFASLGVFGALPSFEELESPEKNFATEIISSDGKTLGKYYKENRTPVKFEELPENIVKALIATEDERFFEHSGIDFKGC